MISRSGTRKSSDMISRSGTRKSSGMISRSGTRKSSGMISRSGTRKSSDMISRSGTRKSSDANVLAVKQGFDVAQRAAGFSEVFRLPLRKMVFRESSDFRYVITVIFAA